MRHVAGIGKHGTDATFHVGCKLSPQTVGKQKVFKMVFTTYWKHCNKFILFASSSTFIYTLKFVSFRHGIVAMSVCPSVCLCNPLDSLEISKSFNIFLGMGKLSNAKC